MGKRNYKTFVKLTTQELTAGINFWWKQKPWWGKDLNNGLYKHFSELRPNIYSAAWWEETLEVLRAWTALRPKSKQFIRERGWQRMTKMATEYHRLWKKCAGTEPSLIDLDWVDAEPLFLTAKAIMGISSPVFASKFCHFMLPGVYPIVDNEVLGGTENYQDYWELCKKLWREAKNKEKLIDVLTKKIGGEIYPNYPWQTKVFEMCLIGHRAHR